LKRPGNNERSRAISAALGEAPFDVLIRNATLVDVATAELRDADVGLIGSLIASVHPRGQRSDARKTFDFGGKFLIPGFIDMHVHFESSHMTPVNYASVVVAQGTTTIFYDPHELANVLGVPGVRYAIEASRGLSVRFICAASSCVPSAPGLETAGASFGGLEIAEMLSWPEVAGVAEMMDMNGVLQRSQRAIDILTSGFASEKLIEGHARGLHGTRLQAFMAAGIGSDHEITSAEDGIEKLRAGMTVELRGSHDYVLPEFVKALNSLPQVPTTLTICTDDVPPDYLLEKGGMSDVLRRLIRCGLDPVQAIRCATLNASLRLRRSDIGLIAAGRAADIAVLDDLREISVDAVFSGGALIARRGKLSAPLSAPDVLSPSEEIPLQPLSAFDCTLRVPGVRDGRARLRIIKAVRFTSLGELDVEVKNGVAILPPSHSFILVQHRHGKRSATPQVAMMDGWGDIRGAVATTYSHDSHNLVVLGRAPADMAAAANALIACGGGIAVAKDGVVIAKCEFPIAGLLSDSSPDTLARDFRAVREAAGTVIDWLPPYRNFKAIEGTSLACNPGPHLTDCGLADGTEGKLLDIILSTSQR
jgi:adenine deaminase